MDKKQLYIEQQSVEDALYTALQQKTLSELQRLSGEVWTDFNAHDPGVTIADISNYVLTELDYKLGFDLIDYMTTVNGEFSNERYGLFSPIDVYPTNPVTKKDYRELIHAAFPTLETVKVYCDTDTGDFAIHIECSPFDNNNDIKERVKVYFHQYRNLCENLSSVTIVEAIPLSLHSEMVLEPEVDATYILAKIYCCIMRYLAGSISVERQDMHSIRGVSYEDLFDGATNGIEVTIPKQRGTEQELIKLLKRIKGVRTIKTCYFVDHEGHIVNDFKDGYRVTIPKVTEDFRVNILIDNTSMSIDMNRFTESLQALYFSRTSNRYKPEDATKDEVPIHHNTPLKGVYRDVFSHSSIVNDFPKCYQYREANPHSLTTYLSLFDLLIQRGLKELKELKHLLSIDDTASTILSSMQVLEIVDEKQNDFSELYRNTYEIKMAYLDLLDHLYGVESYPKWMSNLNYYGDSENVILSRRMVFLRNIPQLTRNKFKSRNILTEATQNNIPTIKAYMSHLLGLNVDESILIGNVLPSYNLILMADDKESTGYRNIMSSMLMEDGRMSASNIENIVMVDFTQDDEDKWNSKDESERATEYERLRRELLVFNNNTISGGLFRGGVNSDNYKLLNLNNGEYLLTFWNDEDSAWVNLGRKSNKDELIGLARILRYFLIELNRKSEAMYVVEHNLLCRPEYFTISFILPDWTVRFKSPRFRDVCRQLLKLLVPVHIKAYIYWLNVTEIQLFEHAYHKWVKGLSRGVNSESDSSEIVEVLKLGGIVKEEV